MNFFMPTRLYTVEHCFEKHGDILQGLGRKCTVITGKHAAKESGALKEVSETLASRNTEYSIFDGISQNPTVASCMEAGTSARAFGAEFLIGIGGGSALDAAKAAAVFAANPRLKEDGFYRKEWENPPLPIVLVGTTAGTGSEVTKVSVLTDSRGRKHSIHDDRLYAYASFGDSRYTMNLPLSVTLTTGIDVLAHCTESYFSKKADQLSRVFAVHGIRLLYEPLSAAAEGKPLSPQQREQLYEASIFGGLAINTTGTCFPHNVGYYLTENYGIPHGFASAAFLPDLLKLVVKDDRDYADSFFREIGFGEDAILSLTGKCLPKNSISMTEAEILAALPRWENNNSVQNTRSAVTTEIIRKILIQKYQKT